jgi:3-oxoacyl-[acyl-carrier-protein] synthase-1
VSTSFAAGPDNIGSATELIQSGEADIAWAGATEGDCWLPMGAYFDNWGAMPSEFNDNPAAACRPYDQNRAGLVMSAGAGVLQLESLDHATARGANIYAEIAGYGSANDGSDMFRPTGEGLRAAIGQALEQAQSMCVDRIDYVNTHGTGTPVGDRIEIAAVRDCLGQQICLSSTKGLTGHAMAGSGAIESVYVMLMMAGGFIAATHNLAIIDPECEGVRHVTETIDTQIQAALKFSVGLGGANSALVFRRLGM